MKAHGNALTAMALYTTRANLGTASCAVGDAQCDEADLQYRPSSTKPWESLDRSVLTLRHILLMQANSRARQDQWHVLLKMI